MEKDYDSASCPSRQATVSILNQFVPESATLYCELGMPQRQMILSIVSGFVHMYMMPRDRQRFGRENGRLVSCWWQRPIPPPWADTRGP